MDKLPNQKSRTAMACDHLRELVIQATFAPGEKLRIDQLVKKLEVSSGAVREALSRLTAEGLVVAEPQKGFVVAPISRSDLQDLTNVRVEIEGRCLADSIQNGDIDWEGRVLSIQHRLRSLAGSLGNDDLEVTKRWHVLHKQFHDELASACTSKWWMQLRSQLYVQSERYRRLSGPVNEFERDIEAEHDAIANAAIARDVDESVKQMTHHLESTTRILLNSEIQFLTE
uniref:Transcriptional regulator n=1 Tax=OCS116 cluster bacterium TaxID=2030921 RepID=A0A2A4YWN3_9PROT